MKAKKMFSAMMAGAMALSLVACGGSSAVRQHPLLHKTPQQLLPRILPLLTLCGQGGPVRKKRAKIFSSA